MDWNARFEEACNLLENDHDAEAAEMFAEVADATNHPKALRMAVLGKIMMFNVNEAELEASGGYGAITYQNVLDEVDRTIRWVLQLKEQGQTTDAEENEWLARCAELKGMCIYKMDIGNKKLIGDTLSLAIQYGSNRAKLYLALYYKDAAAAIANSVDTSSTSKFGRLFKNGKEAQKKADEIQEQTNQYFSGMVGLLEDYIANYSDEGSRRDELPTACKLVSYLYENGLGTTKDAAKAQFYRGIIGE